MNQRVVLFVFIVVGSAKYVYSQNLDEIFFKDKKIETIWKASVCIVGVKEPTGVVSVGSGTFVHSDGWIITAEHVVSDIDIDKSFVVIKKKSLGKTSTKHNRFNT